MTTTYEMAGASSRNPPAPCISSCSFSRRSSMRCGRKNARGSTKRLACRCGRIDRWPSIQAQVDQISGQTTTGHEWDGIRELNTPLPRWWLWLFYLTIAFSFHLLDPLSGLAAGDRLSPAAFSATPIAPQVADGRRRGAGGARCRRRRVSKRQAVDEIAADPEDAGARARARQGGVRRQLRAMPWLGRPGPEGLSQPDGGPLAVGRHAGSDRGDDHPRHPLRDDPDTHTSAMPAFGKRRHPEGGANQRRSPTTCGRSPSSTPEPASTWRPARRSSPIIARPATARTARATSRWARPTSRPRCGSMART